MTTAPTEEDAGPVPDLSDVSGEALGRRAVEVAAAGPHHLLMIGPPGSGKTKLAERLPGCCPAPPRRVPHGDARPLGRRRRAPAGVLVGRAPLPGAAPPGFHRVARRRRQLVAAAAVKSASPPQCDAMSRGVTVSGLVSGHRRVPPFRLGRPCSFCGGRYSGTCGVGEMFRVRYRVVQTHYRS